MATRAVRLRKQQEQQRQPDEPAKARNHPEYETDDDADRQIDDLPAVARDFLKARRGIRRARDTLHSRLRAWDETLEKWAPLSPQHGDLSDITPLIADLYRFLAPRYMPIDEWVAASDYSGQMRRRRRYGRIPG